MSRPRPIVIHCTAATTMSPTEFAEGILDMDNWKTFKGWGPLPGIKNAEILERTDEIVGTRIQATNGDGSQHVETIVEWEMPRTYLLHMDGFPNPLKKFATHFEERCDFKTLADGRTGIQKTMTLYPTTRLAMIPLRLIAAMMKRALSRHLREVTSSAGA